MVLEIVSVIQVGFSGYRIRTTNSKTLCSLGSSQSATTYLSLGFTGVENLPKANLFVQEAYLLPSLGKLYTFAHRSAVRLPRSLLIVPSHSLEYSWENSLAIPLLLKLLGWVSKPSQPIRVRSSTNIKFSPSFWGTVRITDLRLTECSSPLVFPYFVFPIATL